ncbi:MAG: DUF1800 domain-containing protein [Planctomycetes bacterium]|nr:DUF1800 domain-containing protein [Planctomycetota bacterium]
MLRFLYATILLVLLPAVAPAQDSLVPLTEREKAVHLLSRLSFAPTELNVNFVLSIGIDAWVQDQLQDREPRRQQLVDRLGKMETLNYSVAESYAYMRGDEKSQAVDAASQRKGERERVRRMQGELMTDILLRSAFSDRQAEEVLANFWRNHFNVTFRKGLQAGLMIPDWERDIIRGLLWTDFSSMLHATAKHPAMLYYLDQHLSRRKLSEKELDRIRQRALKNGGNEARAESEVVRAARGGPNENYARELMELHTLGVDRVYEQKDVVAVAHALTGWTVDRGSRNKPGSFEFQFDARRHQRGEKLLFDQPMPEPDPATPSQGEWILDELAQHPATAHYLASKMVSYLVQDNPPPQMVADVAAAFEQSNGSLTELVSAVVSHPDFYDPQHFRAKVKTPWEYVVSSLRATDAEVERPLQLFRALALMGQPLYGCDVPTGWSDRADAWLDPGAMAFRWEFAAQIADGKLKGVKIPAAFYNRCLRNSRPQEWADQLALHVIPGGIGEVTEQALQKVLQDYLSGKKAKRSGPVVGDVAPQLLALLLGSPEFQRQ